MTLQKFRNYVLIFGRLDCACAVNQNTACFQRRNSTIKDFKLKDFRFIVVNNIDNPTPLVWVFDKTQASGDIELGNTIVRDPQTIGEELTYYLEHRPDIPLGIHKDKPNSIDKWFSEH